MRQQNPDAEYFILLRRSMGCIGFSDALMTLLVLDETLGEDWWGSCTNGFSHLVALFFVCVDSPCGAARHAQF